MSKETVLLVLEVLAGRGRTEWRVIPLHSVEVIRPVHPGDPRYAEGARAIVHVPGRFDFITQTQGDVYYQVLAWWTGDRAYLRLLLEKAGLLSAEIDEALAAMSSPYARER